MIFVIGIGPGGREHMTGRALWAVSAADVVVGYNFYIDLLGDLTQGKEVVSTAMTREIDRCKSAVELALSGKKVAVVSSGDPGVYGMAGLIMEILEERDPQGTVDLEVVPGVTAANAAASVLGAPLMSDFCVISLSDLLTPWKIIEKRLHAAGAGDFVTALYNPRSVKRKDHLIKAMDILMLYRASDTPVGIVRNALREGQSHMLTTINAASDQDVDMMSVVVVGNSATKIINSRMVTLRGYETKDQEY